MGSEHSNALREARDLVALLGGKMWRTHQDGPVRGDPGLADAWVVRPRNAGTPQRPQRGKKARFWYECKVGEDRLRPAQVAFKALTEGDAGDPGVPVVVGHPAAIADYLGY